MHTGKQEDLAQTVLNEVQRIRGSYALGVVSMDNPEEIVAARRDNPLVIGIGEGENMIASDITAIISRTKQYIIPVSYTHLDVYKRQHIDCFHGKIHKLRDRGLCI